MKIASILFSAAVCSLLSASVLAADTFEDKLLSTPTSPEVTARGFEADGYQLAISAYAWGYPLVRMERVARQYTDVPSPNPPTSYRAPLDRIGWATELATPDAKDMPTANNDTFYMSAVVRLDQPFILSVPDTNDRYYVVNVFNMWQELEHYIGRRTTGTKAGKFAIVPRGWNGTLPAGVTRLDVTTDKVWLWGRLHISQGEAVPPVLALQKEFKLEPLDASKEKAEALEPLPPIKGDDLGFFKHLAFALKDNKIKPADEALFAQFARIGLTKDGFDPSKLPAQTRKGLLRGLADAPSVVVSSLAGTTLNRNGWTWGTGLDSFGFNYPLRAMVAGAYLGGNGEKEAMYPLRATDSDGKALSGTNHYVIKFDREPPVGAFWSLTMYNDADKMLVPNAIHRYKIGGDTKGCAALKTAPSLSRSRPTSRREGMQQTGCLPQREISTSSFGSISPAKRY
nr:DUF1254 domain-containing protein [Rhizobium grahamii]